MNNPIKNISLFVLGILCPFLFHIFSLLLLYSIFFILSGPMSFFGGSSRALENFLFFNYPETKYLLFQTIFSIGFYRSIKNKFFRIGIGLSYVIVFLFLINSIIFS